MSAPISKPTQQWETRYVDFQGRAEVSEDKRIRGHAVVFHSLSLDLGGFRERMKPTVVDRTLRDGLDVRAYFNHDTDKVLGRTRSGTLRLFKDSYGLGFEISPPPTTIAKDLLISIKRGDISGASFRFMALEDDWHIEDGMPIREVSDAIIGEISIVSEPAYPDTDVAVRAMRQFQQTIVPPYRSSTDMLRRMLKVKA